MSNTHEPLSRRDQFLIESFKEQAAAWKHEDNLLHRFTSVILPLSIAALALPYVQNDVPDLLATIGGLTLMTFWALSCQIMHIKVSIRFSIINEIEKCRKILGHKDFKIKKCKKYNKLHNILLRSYYLRCAMFWVYLGIVLSLTWCKWHGPCCTQKALIAETTDSWIIVGAVGFVTFIVGWATFFKTKKEDKDKKDSPENRTEIESGTSAS